MGTAPKTLSLTYRAEPETVPRARRAMSDFARAAGADSRQIDAVRLASSEAITNAVTHAYREQPGPVYVTAALVEGEMWIACCGTGAPSETWRNHPATVGHVIVSAVVPTTRPKWPAVSFTS